MFKKSIFTSLLIVGAAFSQAQSLSSFQTVTNVTGLTSSISGLSLSVTATATPTFTYLSNVYHVNSIFAVYGLDDNDDMTATGTTQNGFTFDTNYAGTGGIAGWKTNPNTGFVGATKNYNYSTKTGTIEAIGYHVRVNESLPGGANTLFIRPSAVPEPTSMIAIGAGLLGLVRRKISK